LRFSYYKQTRPINMGVIVAGEAGGEFSLPDPEEDEMPIQEPANSAAICYVVVRGNRPGERIGLVRMNEKGYYAAKGYDSARDTTEEVEAVVAHLNNILGIPADIATAMECGSMFGWHTPAAAPAVNYFNLKGTPAR
jgi:hypothetical protein